MPCIPKAHRYDLAPETAIEGYDHAAWRGYPAIGAALRTAMTDRRVLVVDCYPGVRDEELLPRLMGAVRPGTVVLSEDFFFDGDELTRRMRPHLTEDSVRGVMYYGALRDFVDEARLNQARQALEQARGTVLVYGVGAALLTRGDVLVYADLARWEIQLRYRRGMANFKQQNHDDDILRKVKRGFFVEWRVADRHKRTLYEPMAFYLDTNRADDPAMVTGEAFRAGLKALSCRPFRLAPYFDAGVWGGQWMKEQFGLPEGPPNYAWGFDGVPEENSLYLRYGSVRLETPAMNLTLMYPRAFLGRKTYARFGAEFPIRFDLLDTIGGQNLSLQVHPTTDYIQNHFGMPYTQDESYYILETAPEGGGVYLGVKEGVDGAAMVEALNEAQRGGAPFDADKYVNLWPAKKHDHFLIPAGTVHCSSAGTMVLEISATPYIFTFKLWDWGRLDLNGRPRPIHIEDGRQVIDFSRDTAWVREQLINRFEPKEGGEGYEAVRTGLHALEFIETQVLTSAVGIPLTASGEVRMLNLVEGVWAVIESPGQAFPPFEVHYAETFILPGDVPDCVIRPGQAGEEIRVVMATVRS